MLSSFFRFHGYGSLKHVYRRGKTERVPFMTLKHLSNPKTEKFRAAVVVGRKVTKSAPKRNRIRRRIYELLRTRANSIAPHSDLIISVFDKRVADMPADKLEGLVFDLLKKSGRLTG